LVMLNDNKSTNYYDRRVDIHPDKEPEKINKIEKKIYKDLEFFFSGKITEVAFINFKKAKNIIFTVKNPNLSRNHLNSWFLIIGETNPESKKK